MLGTDILQPTHLLLILLVALVVLGPKRLPEVGRSLGRGLRDFRQGISGVQDEARGMFSDLDEPSGLPEDSAVSLVPEPLTPATAEPMTQPVLAPDRRHGDEGRAGGTGPGRLRRLTAEPGPVETAALVALLRAGGRAWTNYVLAARQRGTQGVSALAMLEQELGLLSYEALAAAETDIENWRARGYQVLALSDPAYPENLRVVENRPPLLFVAGSLSPADRRAVAVIGTRQPTEVGRALARRTAEALARSGFTVVSGLAAGIDAEAHRATLQLQAGPTRDVRTLAVLGNGLGQVYPSEHAELQARGRRAGCGDLPVLARCPADPAQLSGPQRGHVRPDPRQRDRGGLRAQRNPHPGPSRARPGASRGADAADASVSVGGGAGRAGRCGGRPGRC